MLLVPTIVTEDHLSFIYSFRPESLRTTSPTHKSRLYPYFDPGCYHIFQLTSPPAASSIIYIHIYIYHIHTHVKCLQKNSNVHQLQCYYTQTVLSIQKYFKKEHNEVKNKSMTRRYLDFQQTLSIDGQKRHSEYRRIDDTWIERIFLITAAQLSKLIFV